MWLWINASFIVIGLLMWLGSRADKNPPPDNCLTIPQTVHMEKRGGFWYWSVTDLPNLGEVTGIALTKELALKAAKAKTEKWYADFDKQCKKYARKAQM